MLAKRQYTIGADLDLAKDSNCIKSLLKYVAANDVYLYLAAKRDRSSALSVVNEIEKLCVNHKVSYFPYYDFTHDFPLLKSQVDFWVDKGTASVDLLLRRGSKRVLFATMFHPEKHEGNSVAMRFWLDQFAKNNYQVDLLYYAYDKAHVTSEMMELAKTKYNQFIEVEVQSGLTGYNQNGLNVHADDWCGEEVIDVVKKLVKQSSYDICFTNYSFFTAMMDFVPSYTKKMLLTHDVFTNRNQKMLQDGYKESGWMSITESSEISSCKRVDEIIALQERDASFYMKNIPDAAVHVIPPLPECTPVQSIPCGEKIYIGYIGSHNYVNEINLVSLFNALAGHVELLANVHFLLAGGASLHLRNFCDGELLKKIPHTVIGIVDDIGSFFEQCNVIVNPERGGTGIKIKSLDALAHGVGLITTRGGAIGLSSTSWFHASESIDGLVDCIRKVVNTPELCVELSNLSSELYFKLYKKYEGKSNMLISSKKETEPVVTNRYIEEYAAGYHLELFKKMVQYIDLKDKVVVEVGADEHLITSRLLSLNGAAKVFTYNHSNWCKDEELQENITVVVDDFLNCSLDDGSVDIILGIAVLEHMLDYEKIVEKVHSLLKPNGRFFLQGEPCWTAPNGHHLYYQRNSTGELMTFYKDSPIEDWSHLVLSQEDMEAALLPKVNSEIVAKEIATEIYQTTPYVGSNYLAPSKIIDYFSSQFDLYVEESNSLNPSNEFYEQALSRYSAKDLRCSGLTLFGKKKNMEKSLDLIKERVSIVVPCHNVESFIEECLCSIFEQDYEDIEIVLVDDASQDNTFDIVKRITFAHDNVRLIQHPHNLGLGPARNTGLKYVTGQMVFFLDSDDLLASPTVISSLVNLKDETGANAVVGLCKHLLPSGQLTDGDVKEAEKWGGRLDSIYSGVDAFLGAYLLEDKPMLPMRAWGILGDTTCFRDENLKFPAVEHEDLAVVPFAYFASKHVYYTSLPVVLYRQRPGSISRSIWSVSQSSNITTLWNDIYQKLTRFDLLEYKTEVALRIIEHTIYKVVANSISPDGVTHLFDSIAYISSFADQHVSQKYFNSVYKAIRSLFLLVPEDAKFEKIIQGLNSQNVLSYYNSHNDKFDNVIPPIVNGEWDKNHKMVNDVFAFYNNNASEYVKNAPAMLTEGDRASYFYFASKLKEHGVIIDAGCFVGGTTKAFVEGSERGADEQGILVYDLFRVEEEYIVDWLQDIYGNKFESGDVNFRKFFDLETKAISEQIEVFEGDICEIGYDLRKPIALLGLDCCKSLAITDSVVREFFPYLIPDISVVLHQDYIHEYHPYIHISMELFSDFFVPILEIDGGGVYAWKCVKRILPSDIREILGEQSDLGATDFWYNNSEVNEILLQKKQAELLYPLNKMVLGYVQAVYYKHLGDECTARKIARKCEAQHPEYTVTQYLKSFIGW